MGRKEYDRKRAETAYEDFKQRRASLIYLLGGVCKMCSRDKHLHLHHVVYHPTESNYRRTSKDFWTRLKRLKEAEQHPERFELLCGGCHREWEAVLRITKKLGKEFLIQRLSLL
jgi:hypothetical protein